LFHPLKWSNHAKLSALGIPQIETGPVTFGTGLGTTDTYKTVGVGEADFVGIVSGKEYDKFKVTGLPRKKANWSMVQS
jgi:hypothetical protein